MNPNAGFIQEANSEADCFGKMLEQEGSISPVRFHGQLPDYQSHVFALSIQYMSLALVFNGPLIVLMVVLLTFFEWWVLFYFYRELMLFCEMAMEFEDKIMLYCSKEVKYQQDFATGG